MNSNPPARRRSGSTGAGCESRHVQRSIVDGRWQPNAVGWPASGGAGLECACAAVKEGRWLRRRVGGNRRLKQIFYRRRSVSRMELGLDTPDYERVAPLADPFAENPQAVAAAVRADADSAP